jgi:hypothetical protein
MLEQARRQARDEAALAGVVAELKRLTRGHRNRTRVRHEIQERLRIDDA